MVLSVASRVAVNVPDWLRLLVQVPVIVLPSSDSVPMKVATYPAEKEL